MATDPPTVIEVPAKVWWESRTLWTNILNVIILFVGLVLDAAGVLALSPQVVAWLGIAIAIENYLLRLITKQPIAAKKNQTAEVEAPR